jgi:hypothetical protein
MLPLPAAGRDRESTLTAASRTRPVLISCHWMGSPNRYSPL